VTALAAETPAAVVTSHVVDTEDDLARLQEPDTAIVCVLSRFSEKLLHRVAQSPDIDRARILVVAIERRCRCPAELMELQPLNATSLDVKSAGASLADRFGGAPVRWDGSREQRSDLFNFPQSIASGLATMLVFLAASAPVVLTDAHLHTVTRTMFVAELALVIVAGAMFLSRRSTSVAFAAAVMAESLTGLAAYPSAANQGSYRWGLVFTALFSGMMISGRDDWRNGDATGLWGVDGPAARVITALAIALAITGIAGVAL
jgi:hypothetical protein